jgi:hypothetical protein
MISYFYQGVEALEENVGLRQQVLPKISRLLAPDLTQHLASNYIFSSNIIQEG